LYHKPGSKDPTSIPHGIAVGSFDPGLRQRGPSGQLCSPENLIQGTRNVHMNTLFRPENERSKGCSGMTRHSHHKWGKVGYFVSEGLLS